MHTVDASSNPSDSVVEFSASNIRVCCDSAALGEPKKSSPQLATRTMAFDQTLRPSENNQKTPSVHGFAAATASAQIPSWKRILDIACIILSMPFWLPIMIALAIWIKLASPGPIFFRQERVGHQRKRFMILKFRTMKVNVETQTHEHYLEQLIHANRPMTKLDSAGDPRIIPGGRILRATGLDELPQLFNVLRGEMSLVGPRPCTPHEFGRYQKWQQARVDAPPGLTGYWQVNGKNKTTFTEMIDMDIHYTKKMSLGLDLAIMVKTFPALLAQVIETRMRPRGSARSSAANGSSESITGKC
jgi:lipopolysaccharide/colanic/teichoic acid biosynthesis glycosyltransferase